MRLIPTITTYTGREHSPRSPQGTTVALVVSGQAWRGAHVTRQADELLGRLGARGYEVVVCGSSSGAMATLCAGIAGDRRNLPVGQQEAQSTRDAQCIRTLWHRFAEATYRWASVKHLLSFPFRSGKDRGLKLFPFSAAAAAAFESFDVGCAIGGVTAFQRIFRSPVPLVITATEKVGRVGFRPVYLVKDGKSASKLADAVKPGNLDSLPINSPRPDGVVRINDAAELRAAAWASALEPVFFTSLFDPFAGIGLGGKVLFDGAWSDNAPVVPALVLGATEVFVFNDSQSGLIHQTEVQAQLFKKPFRKFLRFMSKVFGKGFWASLKDTADQWAAPVDISALLRRFPKARIHVVGLPLTYPKNEVGPNLGRFLLPGLELVDPILNSAADGQIEEILAKLTS